MPESAPTPDLDAAELATLAVLDHPDLVLSEGYIGPERRRRGPLAWLRRLTFRQRRSVVGWELAAVAAVAALAVGGWQLASGGGDSGASATPTARTSPVAAGTPPTTAAPVPTTVPPATTVPAVASAPPPTTAPTPTTTVPPVTDPSPQQLGAEALALIRYPWQQIPGYSIQFLPISDAPSPGFYGNTTFTWGKVGGVSDLYVYPGETVERLAGITAFEIAHAVDASALYPNGELAIENAIGVHPGSWAPDCDCAEQGYLSGWYAQVFSNYWSPGVGAWTGLDGLPSTAPASVVPYLNPAIP